MDCNPDGAYTQTAWYELVPAPTRTIKMTVEPGARIIAIMRVVGHRVTVAIADTTRAEYFARTITDHTVDDTSAEWIAEAPSHCTTSTNCTTLPLADFGAVNFANARVQTTTGLVSPISDSRWTTSKLLLGYSAKDGAFVAKTTTANATPSALTDAGRTFHVTYSGDTSTTTTTGTETGTGPGAGGGPGGGTRRHRPRWLRRRYGRAVRQPIM
jgi:Peptidase A4 family